MSLLAFRWAGAQHLLRPLDKLVLLALADCHNAKSRDATVWPSVEWLCHFTGLGRTSVKACVNRLIAAGLIADTCERRGRTGQVRVLRLALDEPSIGEERGRETTHYNAGKVSPRDANRSAGDLLNGSPRDHGTGNYKSGREASRASTRSPIGRITEDGELERKLSKVSNPMARAGLRRELTRRLADEEADVGRSVDEEWPF